MGDVDESVAAAREHLDAIFGSAADLLGAGIDVERVHSRYVTAALKLMEQIELRALVASGGDPAAQKQLEVLVRELRRLREEARAELGDHADGEPGA